MSIQYDKYIIMDIEEHCKGQFTRISYATVTSESILETKQLTVSSENDESVLQELLVLINEHIVITYKANKQLASLDFILEAAGYHAFTGLILDMDQTLPIFFPHATNYELPAVTQLFDLPLVDDREQSLETVDLLTGIFIYQHQFIVNLPLLVIQRLITVYRTLEHIAIRHYLSNIETYKLNSIGSTTLANDVFAFSHMILKKKTIQESDVTDSISDDFLKFFTSEDKEKIFAEFELRPQQQKMLEHVHEALVDEKHLLVEAGTGTGKTLAYLLPLLHFSLVKGTRVVVATNTIILQRQIFERDIPLLQKIYTIPFTVALFKGRNHYVCLRKFNYILSTYSDKTSNTTDILAKLIVWLSITETGEGEELHVKTKKDWQQMSSDSETCLNKKCTFFSHCFYHFAKEKANCANIIITNHSLIFSDIKSDHQILPTFSHIVFDEAHHLENEATKHLGIEIQYLHVKQKLTYLYKDNKNGAISKAKEYVKLLVNQGDTNHEDALDILENLIQESIDFVSAFDDCMASIHQWLTNRVQDQTDLSESIRFTPKLRKEFPYMYLVTNVQTILKTVVTNIDKLEKHINAKDDLDYQAIEFIRNIVLQKKALQQIEADIRFFFDDEDEAYVYWIDLNRTIAYFNVTLHAVPIDVGTILNEKLFATKKSCILTSATLAIRGSFTYAMKRLGLSEYPDDSILTLALDSPFDYQEQCLVCIPTDIPLVRDEDAFIPVVSEMIARLVIETQGKTLVLFTSNRLLKSFYQALEKQLAQTDIKLLGQNIDNNSRSKLIEQFMAYDKAILLGSNSFWEGVDLPGNTLTNVFIMKLPFWPPNMPIVEARTEQLEKQNKNAFMEYSVPEAIIRFKQGFGRLIRTKTDKGTVVLFDRRIVDSRYGSIFIKSLPNPKLKLVKKTEIYQEISEWNKS